MIGFTEESDSSSSSAPTPTDNGTLLKSVIKKYVADDSDFSGIIDLETITFNELRYCATVGQYRGCTILWFLAASTDASLFIAIWHKFKAEFTIDDLRVSPLFSWSPLFGRSLLWMLATDEKTPMLEIWGQFKNHFTFDDFGKGNENSTLLHLSNCHFYVFQEVYNLFKFEFKRKHITSYWHNNEYKGKSLLWVLMKRNQLSSTMPQFDNFCIKIIHEMLTQIPDIFCRVNLSFPVKNDQTLAEVLEDTIDFDPAVLVLINARNALFDSIDRAECGIDYNAARFQELNNLAQIAFDAGYLNAFYDLGNHLIEKHTSEACEAYKKVPPASWKFDKVSSKLQKSALKFYNLAIQPEHSQFERKNYLEQALYCALSITREIRDPIIKLIAYSWLLSDGVKIDMYYMQSFLSEFMLDFIDKTKTVEYCIKVFEEVKRQVQREDRLRATELQVHMLQSQLASSSTASSSESAVAINHNPLLLSQVSGNKRLVFDTANSVGPTEFRTDDSKRQRRPE